MRLSILNVKYSPNLGDGIIAECLEHACAQSPQLTSIESCDLAGRVEFGDGVDKSRQHIRTALSLLPGFLRLIALATILRLLVLVKLRKHYQASLADADIIIIGGGQLIADKDLNFPIKIKAALSAIDRDSTAIALHGVGVAASFTAKGRRIFNAAFKDNLSIANVRDDRSVERWNQNFQTPAASKVWDPGLLTSHVYPKSTQSTSDGQKKCGIGITNPDTLQLHADQTDSVMSRSDWIRFYVSLIETVVSRKLHVELFTNGASDDQSFAEEVLKTYADQNETAPLTTLVQRATTPQGLAEIIARYDVVMSHRLHANIMAYSYAISFVGLGWDSKMEGFFDEVGRRDYLLSTVTPGSTDLVADRILKALSDPIDSSMVKRIQSEVFAQVNALIETVATPKT